MKNEKYFEFKKGCRQLESFYPILAASNDFSHESIENFLDSAKNIDLSLTAKLIAAAVFMSQNVNWRSSCVVFEYLIENVQSEEERYQSFLFWVEHFDAVLDSLGREHQEEELECIADRLKSIIEWALECYPEDWLLAYNFGRYYKRHPGLAENPRLYLKKAIGWFERSLDLASREDEIDTINTICMMLGECFYELGEVDKALEYYKSLDLVAIENCHGKEIRLKISDRINVNG